MDYVVVPIVVGVVSGIAVVGLGWILLTKQAEKPLRERIFARILPNVLLIATFVTLICGGILYLLYQSFQPPPEGNTTNYDFVAGALIGLLGAGISGLVSIASNLSEKNSGKSDDREYGEE